MLKVVVRLAAVAAAALLSFPAHAAAPVAVTHSGKVRGFEQNGVNAFLGLPFAAPPLGANRWRAPQPVRSWRGVREATTFGNSCWQAVSPQGFGPWTHEYVVQGDVSEDCLFLNIWAPAQARKRPVLVWIHGGGFNSGSGGIPIYHGQQLANRGILVVTINYRVNVFGFLAHPDLTREAGPAAGTNFGLQDILASLRWVRQNIAKFGGDPDAVTIAGQSAGAGAVHALIASPPAKGLFARAIVQSSFPARPTKPLAAAEQDGLTFGAENNAPVLAALRAMSAEALQPSRGSNAIRFAPVVDGVLLPRSPEDALRTGRAADVPVLAGFTADEGSALSSAYELNVQRERDRWLGMFRTWAADRAAGGATKPVYGYIFTKVAPGKDAAKWRAFHSSEIPYVFGTLGAAPERGFSAADVAFSDRVSRYWINFVRSGNPNGVGLPEWPAFNRDRPQLMQLGEPMRPILLGATPTN
jgi:para-nitrobenzyl esterase